MQWSNMDRYSDRVRCRRIVRDSRSVRGALGDPRLPKATPHQAPELPFRRRFFAKSPTGNTAGTLLQSGVLGSACGFSCQAYSIPQLLRWTLYLFSVLNAIAPFPPSRLPGSGRANSPASQRVSAEETTRRVGHEGTKLREAQLRPGSPMKLARRPESLRTLEAAPQALRQSTHRSGVKPTCPCLTHPQRL